MSAYTLAFGGIMQVQELDDDLDREQDENTSKKQKRKQKGGPFDMLSRVTHT